MNHRICSALARVCVGLAVCLSGCDDGQDGGAGRDSGCATRDACGSGDGGGDGGGGARADGSMIVPGDGGSTPDGVAGGGPECEVLGVNEVPGELACTGLYEDIEAKRVAPGVRAFAPALELWSDGAEKRRWIYLPEGTQIDSAAADDWQFPVGTKLFKEFRWNGHRVETRMFWKTADRRWLRAAYHWNADETRATRFGGGEVDVAGDAYYIPSAKECDQCHKGRDDRALGFELISLALPGATGLTLSELMTEDLLTDPPAQSESEFEIGDDGTGKAAAALGWLHVNCGVSCHNGNSASEGFASDLRLRLPADGIDGRASGDFDAVRTSVGIEAQTPRWSDRTRIVPGSPEDSLLFFLLSTRDPVNPKDQMPPIASRVVDDEGVARIGDWIRELPASP